MLSIKPHKLASPYTCKSFTRLLIDAQTLFLVTSSIFSLSLSKIPTKFSLLQIHLLQTLIHHHAAVRRRNFRSRWRVLMLRRREWWFSRLSRRIRRSELQALQKIRYFVLIFLLFARVRFDSVEGLGEATENCHCFG